MIQKKNQNILFTWMQVTYMVMQCLNLLVREFKFIDPKDFDLKNTERIVQKVVFLKLILNIQKNFVNYVMIIL